MQELPNSRSGGHSGGRNGDTEICGVSADFKSYATNEIARSIAPGHSGGHSGDTEIHGVSVSFKPYETNEIARSIAPGHSGGRSGDTEINVVSANVKPYETNENTRSIAPSTAETANDTSRAKEHTEAETLFLSGSAYLSLKEFEKAAELFLGAAKLSPSEPKNWLYLLAAVTERFTVLHRIADGEAKRSAGKRKVVCASVYKNLVATATKDDYIFAKSEFDIDLDPDGEELWECMIAEIIRGKLPYEKAAALAHVAVSELERTHPQTAKRYYPALCRRLNPVRDGVLEVNTLEYYPDAPDGVLRLDTDADSVEFASDTMLGSERFSAFMLTKGIENIGTHFPFAELTVEEGVTRIPEKLMGFCGGIELVRLSSTVKKIGKQAFSDCVNLHSITPLDSVEEIGDKAFFGTGIRVLDVPSSVKKLGSDVLGIKSSRSAECEIAKYLIKIDAELASVSPDFNRVGDHRCGYVLRENVTLRLVYPIKTVDGKARSLTHDEKMIFKALAYVSIGDGDLKKSPMEAVKDFFSGIWHKVFK